MHAGAARASGTLTQRLAARLQQGATILVIILAIILVSVFETTALVVVMARDVQSDRLIGADAPLRNLLELFAFVSTIAVAVIAALAIPFARQQASEARKAREEAENSRLTSIDMSIVERWNAPAQVQARVNVSDIVTRARQEWEATPALHGASRREHEKQCLCDHLQALKAGRRTLELRGYTIILQFFEDLGTLCRKQYVRNEDVYDLLGSSIEYQIETFERYIAEARKPPGSTTTYANLIYLYRKAITFRGSKYIEAEWPLRGADQSPAP